MSVADRPTLLHPFEHSEAELEPLRDQQTNRWDRWPVRASFALFILVVAVLTGGVLMYAAGEGDYTLRQALFFSLITVSTVGYGELPDMQSHEWSRASAALTIIFGLIVISFFQSTLTAILVQGAVGRAVRKRRMMKKIKSLAHHHILVGCGRVGRYVAEELYRSDCPFVVIEQNPQSVHALETQLGKEVLYIEGDATDDSVLEFAGIHRAAGLVTTLGLDRDNLFVTLSARTLAPDLRIIAKVANSQNEGKLRRAGASTTVSPQSIGGTRLAHELVRPGVMAFFQDMLSATDGVRFHEFMISAEGELTGLSIAQARLREDFGQLVVGMRSIRGKQYAPSQDDILEPGISLVTLGTVSDASRLKQKI